MWYTAVILSLLSSNLVTSLENAPNSQQNANKEADLSVEKLSEQNPQKRQETNNENVEKGRQNGFGGPPFFFGDPFAFGNPYYQPQIQLPGYNFDGQEKQAAFPRVQPQILFYGPGGQGQPILINPGNPPGNFLVPQPGGTNLFRGQNPNFFGGEFPRPGNVPPIEKDAEEVPTNPEKIPPLEASGTKNRPRPEKLQSVQSTYNMEQYNRNQNPKLSFESLIPGLPEAQRQRLFPDIRGVPPELDPTDLNNYARPFPGYPAGLSAQFQDQPAPLPSQLLLVGNNNVDGSLNKQEQAPSAPQREANLFGFTQPALGNDEGNDEYVPQYAFFRNGEIGRFRFTPPETRNVFPFREDVDNEAIIVDANFERDAISAGNTADRGDSGVSATASQDEPSPSMAQAAPGAIAIAGPGGVAGSAPRGTALVGRGGLAVASPQATAVAGTRDEEKAKKPAAETSTAGAPLDKVAKN